MRDYNVFTNTQVETLDELRNVVVSPAGGPEGRPVIGSATWPR